MSEREDSASSRWLETLASLLVGTPLLLALRASGVSHRWQVVADVIVAILVVLNGAQPVRSFGEARPTTSFMYFSLGTISTAGVGLFEASRIRPSSGDA